MFGALRSVQPLRVLRQKLLLSSVMELVGADSTRFGIGRSLTWRLPPDEASHIEIGKSYVIDIGFKEYMKE